MSGEWIHDRRAELYDRVYAWKDYASEAARLRETLSTLGVGPGSRVLEAACGTGNYLVHFKDHYEASGFDLHQGMLTQARRKLPDTTLWTADMRDLQVDAPYDALLCLFSSIGYLLDEASLAAAARCFAAALRPGGALVVEPWLTVEQWSVGRPHLVAAHSPELHLARGNIAERDGEMAVMEMHWLIIPQGGPVEHLVDRHVMWLCPRETMRRVFEEAGFEVRFDPDGLGRGLFLGIRKAQSQADV